MWSERPTMRGINPSCPCGQSVPQHAMSIHSVCMVRACPDILPMWSECTATCCINPSCPCGKSGLPYIAHVVGVSQCAVSIHSVYMVSIIARVVRVSHNSRYQFMVSTWSEWITIYCPCGQSVPQCAVSIHRVHVVSIIAHVVSVSQNARYQFIVSRWSE